MVTTAVFRARPDGSSANGGGYDAASAISGSVDYSDQAVAQLSVSDGVTNGTTTVTSATGGFTAAMTGNVIKIAAARYVIKTVTNTNSILVEATITGGTGRAIKVGGAVARPDDLSTDAVGGNIIYWHATAVQNIATTIALSFSGSDGAPLCLFGYTTTVGDLGLMTLKWTGAGAGTIMDVTGTNWIIGNLIFDGNGKTADRGMRLTGINNFAQNVLGRDCNLSALDGLNLGCEIHRSEATNNGSSTGSAGFNLSANARAVACAAYGNVGNGFAFSNAYAHCHHCSSRGNTKSGFYVFGTGALTMSDCVTDGNTLDGLRFDGTPEDSLTTILNSIFSNNLGYGIRSTTTDYNTAANVQQGLARRRNNAFYNNTLGARFQYPAGTNDRVPTTDPYVSQATFNYLLNGISTGGGVLRGTGYPDGIGLLGTPQNTAAATDVGLVQGPSLAGSGSTYQTMVSLWRELACEPSTVIDDTVPTLYIDSGMEALNRRLRFHWTTDQTLIVLVAGTQEYLIPSDCSEIRWVQWNGKELPKGSVDEWRARGEDWKNEPAGQPQQWAIYGNRFVIRPTPSADAIAVSASPLIRYCSKPPSIAITGGDQLNSQDWRLPVYWGVAEYSASWPDSAAAQSRAQHYKEKFETESGLVARDYADRTMDK